MQSSRPLLAVTPGDPGGIGPEITWKALRSRDPEARLAATVCVGARAPFDRMNVPVIETTAAAVAAGEPRPRRKGPFVWLIPAPAGKPGFQAGWSIETATKLVLKGAVRALVTGPIDKGRLQAGGYRYDGHTELLADLCGAKSVTMMLANDRLRVTLVTTHRALRDVHRAVTPTAVRRAIVHTDAYLRSWFGIARPRVGVAALNPHAGDHGLFGDEETTSIVPGIRAARRSIGARARVDGPIAGDAIFTRHIWGGKSGRYDGIVCMYHDQGLIPVKMLDFPGTVNVTLGLPIIRTSVDHGVAFDIAGKGIADPSSMVSALRMALRLARSVRKK